MKYVIHEVDDDLRMELAENFGIEFDDADLITTYEDDDEGSIRTVPALNLTIFDAGNHTIAVFPIDESIYETLDPSEMLDIFKAFVKEYDEHPKVVVEFQKLTKQVMEPEVWIVHIPALLLEDTQHGFTTKQGPQQVRIRSYLIKHDQTQDQVSIPASRTRTFPRPDNIRFDAHAVHTLCNNAIDFAYLMKSLKPSAMVNILFTVFEKDDLVVAIRVTKLRSGPRAEIKGAYACSKGFGTLIQEWTENLIRQHNDTLFPTRPENRPVTFRLSALPSAVGFWKHVGFQATGERDKEGQEILEKRIFPEKRPRSHSPTSSSAKTTKIIITH